jgi:hypothetical protein
MVKKYMHEGKEVLKVDIQQSGNSRADSRATFHFVDGTTTTEDDTALIIERVEEWCKTIGWVKQEADRFKYVWVPPKTAEANPKKRPAASDESGAEAPPMKKQSASVELQGPCPGTARFAEQPPVQKQSVSLKASFELRGPLGTIGIGPGMDFGKKWTTIDVVPGDRSVLEEEQRKRLNSSAALGGGCSVGDIESMNAYETGKRYSDAIDPGTGCGGQMFYSLMQSETGAPGFEYQWTNSSEDHKTSGEVLLVSGHIISLEKGIDWSEDSDKKQLARMEQAEDERISQMTST